MNRRRWNARGPQREGLLARARQQRIRRRGLAEAYRGEVPELVLDAGVKQLLKPVDWQLFAKWMVTFFASALS